MTLDHSLEPPTPNHPLGQTPVPALWLALLHFFETDQWPYAIQPDRYRLNTQYQGNHGLYSCYGIARLPAQQVIFYTMCPVTCSKNHLPAMAEFLHRANYNLALGNFELDWRDGEIRFKCSADIEGLPIADPQVSFPFLRNLTYACVLGMDRYMPGVLGVLGGQAPTEAIAAIENRASI